MLSSLRVHTLAEPWQFALIGVGASLPVTAILDWLPNSEATIGGGSMICGAFIAGVIAAVRSANPSAAGLRAGFIGAVLGLLVFIGTVGTTVAWSLSGVVFWVFASGLVVCMASLFGLGFGRFGGWVATTVRSRWTTTTGV
jgi:hypothetical protein